MSGVHVAANNAELARARALSGGAGCVFVPTMGALHQGHAALLSLGVSLALERGLSGGCVASIFVNPTQFNEKADFERYPRTLEADLALCAAAGAAVVYVPRHEDVYPAGTPVTAPPLPDVATRPGLEDSHRPGHFAGVCQVVARLFDLVRPAAAVFGEKDWQQLAVVRAMEASRSRTQSTYPAVEVIGAPTVREPDGLAMSSRNRFLSPPERARALTISRALCKACENDTPDGAESVMRHVLAEAGITPEYAAVREASSLVRPADGTAVGSVRWRALIAARVGAVRLIDNCAWVPTRSAC